MTGQGAWWRRVLVAGAAGVVLAGGLIAPAVAAAPGDRIGTGKIACVPGPGVDCRDVVHKWAFTHHGDLSGAKFARAKLHGADLRGARLNKANFRGVVLRHAQLQDASLKGANFSPTRPRGRVMRAEDGCNPNRQNADLSGANLSFADLTGAVFCNTTMPDGSTNNSGC